MSTATEVTARHRFDSQRLHEYLAATLPGFAGPLDVMQFQGGQSNPTYLLATPTRRYVLRSKPAPAARLLPSAHAIEREFRVMRAMAAHGIPVPEMLALCDDESVIGRAFFVMSYVEGRIFWDPALPQAACAERAAIYDEMNRVLAALHAIEPAAAGLADFGRPGNYFARQIDRWSRQYRASETETIDEMNRLLEWLPAHVPPDEETAVVHGDYRIDNLVFHPTEPRIVAVLDWELSTLGHPLADFSCHCMAWHIPPGVFRGLAGVDLPALGIPTAADYVRRYCERTGRASIAQWPFYLAYNLFRIAAILQGVYKRATEGIAASDDALQTGRNVRALAQLGWQFARQSC